MSNRGEEIGQIRRFLAVALAVVLVGAGSHAWAKARYAGEEEMIAEAEAIAIVNVTKVEKVVAKAEPFDYGQIAYATVEQTLKGTLPATLKLYGDENFVCARVEFAPGRQLVFLGHRGEFLGGCNWYLSVRPIANGQLEWFTPGESLKLLSQPLDKVLERVRGLLAKAK